MLHVNKELNEGGKEPERYLGNGILHKGTVSINIPGMSIWRSRNEEASVAGLDEQGEL
jgi:hypothetical protein